MKTTIELLQAHSKVSDYKINIHRKESYELFFVKGKLETVRCTDTCDKEVTVYVDHDDYKGDAQFFVYPSTTGEQICELIEEAVGKALLINNQKYELPQAEQGDYAVESNFSRQTPSDLAAVIVKTVFAANTDPDASLNSVEVFVAKHTESVQNSRGLFKTQVRYDAMVEAIPTYNGTEQSVELYEQYNFGALDEASLHAEMAEKMEQVKARYKAVRPEFSMDCPVILNKDELATLFYNLVGEMHYSTVYSKSNLFSKGDAFQKDPQGDRIGITMAGEVPGCMYSANFDEDGMSLGSIRIAENGKVLNYFGSNRFGQYLGETPTGNMRCIVVDAGSVMDDVFVQGPSLEIVSMSGLQVDLNNDYIGGEIRLAYYRDGEKKIPVTGISVSGTLSEVLSHIRLSATTGIYNRYVGPEKAILSHMKIF